MKKIIILLIFSIVFFSGCAGDHRDTTELVDKKPDDEISKIISENKPENFYYTYHETDMDGVLKYHYWGDELTAESICKFAEAAMEVQVDGYDKVAVVVDVSTYYGNAGAFVITNYNNDFISWANYSEMSVLKLLNPEGSWNALYDPNTFTNISGVRYLIIDEQLQGRADKEGIDWFEVWPDLEGVETF